MEKLLELPVDRIFPVLDLYRIFLTHPDATCHFKKYEDGKSRIWVFVNCLNAKNATDPTIMLSLRCLCNVFKDMNGQFCLREMRERVVEAVAQHLSNAKANIREPAVTVLLNYSIAFLTKDDAEGRIQAISAMGAIASE